MTILHFKKLTLKSLSNVLYNMHLSIAKSIVYSLIYLQIHELSGNANEDVRVCAQALSSNERPALPRSIELGTRTLPQKTTRKVHLVLSPFTCSNVMTSLPRTISRRLRLSAEGMKMTLLVLKPKRTRG